MLKIQPQMLAPYIRYLPPAANFLLVVLIAASLAHIFWLVFPTKADESALSIPPPSTGGHPFNRGRPRLDIEQIVGANLFGQHTAASQAGAGIDAPETSLNLTLKGIFASGKSKASRALIADPSGKEKPYSVGDDVPGGATLNSIQVDRVILERSGRYETLRLERDKGSGGNAADAAASEAPSSSSPGQATSLSALRNEVLQDPAQAAQYVRLQPVYSDNKLQGYRIYPGPNRDLFQKVGLRAGELVTSVNGVQLDDAAKAMQLLGDLKDAQQVTLTLERAGQTRTVNLSLNQ